MISHVSYMIFMCMLLSVTAQDVESTIQDTEIKSIPVK